MRLRKGKKTGNRQLFSALFFGYLRTAILSELAFSACTVIDGIITGKCLGPGAIAAVGIVAPFPSLLAVVSGMLGVGCSQQCSMHIGKGNREEANRVYTTAFLFAAVASAVMTLIYMVFAENLVISWGASRDNPELVADAAAYLRACAVGTAGMILWYIFSPALSLEGRWNYLRYSTYAMIVANIGGDLLAVFVFKSGVRGVGLVTAFSNLLATAVLLAGRLKKGSSFRVRFRDFRPGKILTILYKGISKAVRRACNAARPIFMNSILAPVIGVAGLAAFSIQGNLRALIAVVSAGIAGVVSTLCGVLYAEEDRKNLGLVMKNALKSILMIAAPMALILTFLAPLIVKLYLTGASEVQEEAVIALRCYCLSVPFVVFNEIYINYFQATGRVIHASIVSALSRIGVLIPVTLLLSAVFGADGIWYSLLVSEIVLALLISLYALLGRRKGSILEKLLALPAGFGASEQDVYQASVGSREECVGIYAAVRDFLLERGADAKSAYAVSLCCEELLRNIAQHSYQDKPDISVELKVVRFRDDSVTVRIRDNGPLFNPVDWYKAHNPDDPTANIGIRIVAKKAKEFTYSSTFKVNNTFIRV